MSKQESRAFDEFDRNFLSAEIDLYASESVRVQNLADFRRLETSGRHHHDEHKLNRVARDRRVHSKSNEVTSQCPDGKEKDLATDRHTFFRPRPREKLEI